MPVLDATVGGANANSYATLAEANTYFDERVPLPTPWVASGDASIRGLLNAARTLNAMATPHKMLRRGCDCNFFYTSKTWTGSPLSPSQRMAWPRTGMTDQNGRSLDFQIVSISVAASTVVETAAPHGLQTGQKIAVVNSNSTPVIDGEQTVTVLSTTTFSIPITVTVAGTEGHIGVIPRELKEAQAELAGQLLMADTTLDNAVIVGGITSVRAGSVSVSFKEAIDAHVLPDAVKNLMPPWWFTDEIVEPAVQAIFGVVSNGSEPWPGF